LHPNLLLTGFLFGTLYCTFTQRPFSPLHIFHTEARVDFFVQVPFDVTPEEKFRVTVGDCEVILVCPDICAQGERIVLSVLRDSDK
jgi:hypothetical protein